MHLKIAVLVYLCLTACFCFSQSTEEGKLLSQAEQLALHNPAESETIAEHTLKMTKSDLTKIRSLYVMGLASFVKGDYDLALNRLYESKDLAATKGRKDYQLKNQELINRIFDFLLLENDKKIPATTSSLVTEDLIKKANASLANNQIDSAKFYANQLKSKLNEYGNGYLIAKYNELLGDIEFKQKAFGASLNHYQKAISTSFELNNPFLNEDFYRKAAASYLAMDSLSKFQNYTEKAKELNVQTSNIETRASNEAHKLKMKDLDKEYESQTALYRNLLWIIGILLMIAVVIKIISYFRNKNRLKMYNRLQKYLNQQEEPIRTDVLEEEPKLEEIKVSEVAAVPKSSSLLKESEEQILSDLEKFESSKGFTHKDMSLGKLASKLNTNTKYLSEVINQQKGMNFNSYINKLRIDYITEKMKSEPAYLNYKVSYLAQECGYSSHSTFTTVFKSIVGVSPIMFVDFVKEESQKEEVVANEQD